MWVRLTPNRDFTHSPEDLAALWCTVPDELIPRNERDFLQRYRKVIRITHPDKHRDVSTNLQAAMEDLTRSIIYGIEALQAYMDRMRRGEVRAPPAAQGIYYQEWPYDFTIFVQDAVWTVMRQIDQDVYEGSPGLPIHNFSITSEAIHSYPRWDDPKYHILPPSVAVLFLPAALPA